MWWRELRRRWRRHARLAAILAAAGLTAGCFEPLYGTRPSVNAETVHDKLAAIDIPPIKAPQGSPVERIAVGMNNALRFDLNGGAVASAPTHRLVVNVGTTQWTVVIDHISGRPSAQVDSVVASYQLVEIATNKVVVKDSTFAHVDYDIPGVEQRFAKQRAQRDAEDRAIQVVAETIRDRLASYFVAGT
ncbi:MAG TPA: LPS assembly lipoprotein LptE [Xanthobacteraceae bacterium]|nr:LPS assembly lipoprotein LptE [Xanthobacteraceae bacterium]